MNRTAALYIFNVYCKYQGHAILSCPESSKAEIVLVQLSKRLLSLMYKPKFIIIFVLTAFAFYR